MGEGRGSGPRGGSDGVAAGRPARTFELWGSAMPVGKPGRAQGLGSPVSPGDSAPSGPPSSPINPRSHSWPAFGTCDVQGLSGHSTDLHAAVAGLPAKHTAVYPSKGEIGGEGQGALGAVSGS